MHDERAPGQLLPGESHGYCHETTRRVRNCPMEMCQTLGRCCANDKPRTDVLVDTSVVPPKVAVGYDPSVKHAGRQDTSPAPISSVKICTGCGASCDMPHRPTCWQSRVQWTGPNDGGSRADGPLLDALEIAHVDPSVKYAGRQDSALAKGLARESAAMRGFATGATRSNDAGRIDPEGFMNPLVVEAFCNYMSKHRVQADGNLRASDNWQKGMPRETAIKGMFRHFMHLWTRHRGLPVTDEKAAANIMEDLCAIRFNVDVYLWEIIRENIAKNGRPW